jgi:hypothetical protein
MGPGALKLKILNGEGSITEDDRDIIGDGSPEATGGFTHTAMVKGFDFSANYNWYMEPDIQCNRIEFTTRP